MSLLGRATLLLALAAAVYAVVAALTSRTRGRRGWQESAERAVYGFCALMTIAIVTMWAALLTDQWDLRYVTGYSSSTLGARWKLSALWASQPGSLLLWAWLLSVFATVAVLLNRRRHRELMPVAVAVLMGIGAFFAFMLAFVTSPFETLAVVPANGSDLNPLLQNEYMVAHPPMLYLGYVALAVPFSFAVSALVTRRLDATWIAAVRRWTIFAWLFLGIGILLGARWAYEELGWGGYWAWDPVENAAFMPWLLATAFLHSVMVQERRGMLRVWNMVLVVLTFVFAVFGTFLTRSGIVASVHAFGESTLGPFFLAFIVIALVGPLALIVSRLPLLRSRHSLESFASREAVFLFNNLLLIGLTFATLWGTLYPVLTEAVTGDRITVGQGFYNTIALPIGVALLALTGVGPLIPWRKASLAQLKRRFTWPLAAAAAAAPLLLLTDAWDRWVVGAIACIAVFVLVSIAGEFWRGMKVRHALGGVSWPGALGQLVARNRRRYGGYIVHVGVVVLFIGLAGSRAFVTEGSLVLSPGERGTVGERTFVLEDTSRAVDPHKMSTAVRLGVYKDGEREATLAPGRNLYLASQQPSTEVAIDSSPTRDVYAVLVKLDERGQAVLSIFVNPLVMWLWISGLIIVGGGVVAAWPARRTARAPAEAPEGAERRATA
ncbi:MAG: heme lyase CcmF/NrfE family subunit [Actinomycetota bacterium]